MSPAPEQDPQAAAEAVARGYLKLDTDPASLRRAALRFVIGAVESAVLIPLIFKLRFGVVGDLGWGTTVFFVAWCLLAAVGLFFQKRPEFHTTVKLRGDWLDHLGAFWLVACAFGPFFGWLAVNVLPVTAASWAAVYGLRLFLAAGLPLLTAIPLTRYITGKSAWVSLPLLVLVTLLPISSAWNTSRDLREGPQGGVLVHTRRALGSSPNQ